MTRKRGGAHLPGHALDAEWCPVYIDKTTVYRKCQHRLQVAVWCILVFLVIAAVVLAVKTAASIGGTTAKVAERDVDTAPEPPEIAATKLDTAPTEQANTITEQSGSITEQGGQKPDGIIENAEQPGETTPCHMIISETVLPLSEEYQTYMLTYCEMYGCPYILALATAEVESHFDMDAVGTLGEVGIMQLNPGPAGAYHAEIKAETGLDPTTPEGNIAGGCYKLGKYMQEYNDPNKAVMAYNMGATGAKNAWANGITSTEHSCAVVEAMTRWDEVVSAWYGT